MKFDKQIDAWDSIIFLTPPPPLDLQHPCSTGKKRIVTIPMQLSEIWF